MPWGYVELRSKVNKEENLFLGDSQLPLQIARTRVRLLYDFVINSLVEKYTKPENI